MKKIQVPVVFLFFMLLLTSGFSSQSQNKASGQNTELEKILIKCAEYCERLSNSVLFFICNEKVKEELYLGFAPTVTLKRKGENAGLSVEYRSINSRESGAIRHIYLYDYQLIRKDQKISEKRKLLEFNGKKYNEENARLLTKFHHKYIITGPIGLLSSYWQMFHDYRIVKEGRFKGDKVYIIEAISKPGYTFSHLIGKIWVRKNDFNVMKIEWDQDGIEGYEIIEETAKELRLIPKITLTAEYAFEKKGIRFPSKYQIIERYGRKRKRGSITFTKIMVEYKDYKFFTVETNVKYSEQTQIHRILHVIPFLHYWTLEQRIF